MCAITGQQFERGEAGLMLNTLCSGTISPATLTSASVDLVHLVHVVRAKLEGVHTNGRSQVFHDGLGDKHRLIISRGTDAKQPER